MVKKTITEWTMVVMYWCVSRIHINGLSRYRKTWAKSFVKKTCQNHSGSDPIKLPILLQIQKFQLYLVVNKASWNFFQWKIHTHNCIHFPKFHSVTYTIIKLFTYPLFLWGKGVISKAARTSFQRLVGIKLGVHAQLLMPVI